jgi:hypothetical protein
MTQLKFGSRTLSFRRSPLVMGVLNVTPDSFSDGGRYVAHRAAIEHAHRMAAEGADIIDVGGESTRPGSETVAATEELARVLPVIEVLVRGGEGRPRLPIPISIDTRKPEPANYREIIPQAADSLVAVHMVGNQFVCTFLKDARTQVKMFDVSGKFVREVEFPTLGTASGFSGKGISPRDIKLARSNQAPGLQLMDPLNDFLSA